VRRLRELTAALLLAACGHQTVDPAATPRPTASRSDELRPDSPNTTEPPPGYAPGDVVERYEVPDASVVVHYTRLGQHRVPALDADDSGVPDFVESVGATYRDVRVQYHGPWGFRPPPDDALIPGDNGGDQRFDVYLVDFALRADGAFRKECLASDPVHCTGYMIQENDFSGYAYPTPLDGVVTVSSHEYFHGVQAGYSAVQGVNVTEGTAVWATERFAPRLDDLEGFAQGYLSQPERSLDQEPSTAVDSYAYGLALFFECLTALRGETAVRDLWARIDGGASWLGTLERNVAEDGGSIAAIMERCADYNAFTGSRARGGFGHARAAQLPLAAVTESGTELSVPRARMFRASSRYYHVTNLQPGAVAYWRAHDDAPDGGHLSIRVRFALDGAGAPAFVAVPPDMPVPVGGAAAHVLVSNVATGGASVPVQLCVASPSFVEQCRPVSAADAGLDAGVMDAGMNDGGVEPPPPPGSCGCGAGGAPLVLLAVLGLRRKRRS
jgi:hypothetical protein